MKEITVAVIGSGSTYCPELVDGFIKAQSSLKLKKISFMDIDERKRTIVGNLCLRMLKKAGIECETLLTDNLDEALQGADFVLTQIRVGMLHARYLDETIPLKYDLIGQETTGIGGFFKALRTIPVMQHICDRIEAICPNAWLINFTNPSGIITEFVLNHTNVKCMGLCNVPINMIDDTKEAMGDDCDITYVGLNHLSWITSVKKDGKELIDDMLAQGFSTKVMAIASTPFAEFLRLISSIIIAEMRSLSIRKRMRSAAPASAWRLRKSCLRCIRTRLLSQSPLFSISAAVTSILLPQFLLSILSPTISAMSR